MPTSVQTMKHRPLLRKPTFLRLPLSTRRSGELNNVWLGSQLVRARVDSVTRTATGQGELSYLTYSVDRTRRSGIAYFVRRNAVFQRRRPSSFAFVYRFNFPNAARRSPLAQRTLQVSGTYVEGFSILSAFKNAVGESPTSLTHSLSQSMIKQLLIPPMDQLSEPESRPALLTFLILSPRLILSLNPSRCHTVCLDPDHQREIDGAAFLNATQNKIKFRDSGGPHRQRPFSF